MKELALLSLAILLGLLLLTSVAAETRLFLPLIPSFPPPKTCDAMCIARLQHRSPDEYVQIENGSQIAQDLTGWQLHSVRGDQWYDFPTGHVLAPGDTVRVHSGEGALHDPPDDLLWTTAHRWNDEGDTARLLDDQGDEIDVHTYGEPAPWLFGGLFNPLQSRRWYSTTVRLVR